MRCAGARLIALLYQKYVLHLGWSMTLHPKVRVERQHEGSDEDVSGTVSFLHSLLDSMQASLLSLL